MTVALALQILAALLADFPELLTDAKALIADIEGKQAPPPAPIAPQIMAEDAAALDALPKT
jgi:hypothetical protein